MAESDRPRKISLALLPPDWSLASTLAGFHTCPTAAHASQTSQSHPRTFPSRGDFQVATWAGSWLLLLLVHCSLPPLALLLFPQGIECTHTHPLVIYLSLLPRSSWPGRYSQDSLFHFMFLLRRQLLLRPCYLKNSPLPHHPSSGHSISYRLHLSTLSLPDIFFILITFLSH